MSSTSMEPSMPSYNLVYDTTPQNQSGEELILFQETVRNHQPSPTCRRQRAHQVVYINQASERDLQNTLNRVEGLGTTFINRLLTQRAVNGPFQGPDDFDRRIKRLRYARFSQLCDKSGIQLSFQPPTTPAPKRRETRSPLRYIDRQFLATPNEQDEQDDLDIVIEELIFEESTLEETISEGAEDDSVVLATWNTGGMSKSSLEYAEKLANLIRFVRESAVDILCLQEVSSDVPHDVCRNLRLELTGDWTILQPDFSPNERHDDSLTIIYQNDTVNVQTTLDRRFLPMSLANGFLRKPQTAFISRNGSPDEITMLLHVHLCNKDPREEIRRITPLLKKLEQFADNLLSFKPAMLVVGDFNMCSDAVVFGEMRRMGFVEMFRPPSTSPAPHPYKTVQHCTTVGGKWFDNVWVADANRGQVRNAWCFEFGGRTKDLKLNAHRFAAKRKAVTSDHLPVSVQLTM